MPDLTIIDGDRKPDWRFSAARYPVAGFTEHGNVIAVRRVGDGFLAKLNTLRAEGLTIEPLELSRGYAVFNHLGNLVEIVGEGFAK